MLAWHNLSFVVISALLLANLPCDFRIFERIGSVMRVITGSARGRRLNTPSGLDVRPTVDRVKEGIFSAIQFDIEGRRVLDLFAGSGQLGIEALSRGAAHCTFADNSKASVGCIKSNISTCGFEDKSTVLSTDSVSFISTCNDTFDIAFLDPPYKSGLYEKVLPPLVKRMSDYGVIFCEHLPEVELPKSVGDFSVCREYRYGKVIVTAYRKSGE